MLAYQCIPPHDFLLSGPATTMLIVIDDHSPRADLSSLPSHDHAQTPTAVQQINVTPDDERITRSEEDARLEVESLTATTAAKRRWVCASRS